MMFNRWRRASVICRKTIAHATVYALLRLAHLAARILPYRTMRALLTHTLRFYRPGLLRQNVKPLELEPERPLRHLANLASLALLPPEHDDELRAQLRIPETADVDAFHADAVDFADLSSDELIGGYDELKGKKIRIEGYLEEFSLSRREADELIMAAREIVYK